MIFQTYENVIIVGGSGLYLRGFYYPVVDDASIEESINVLIDDMYESHSLGYVVNEFLKVNDREYQDIDL